MKVRTLSSAGIEHHLGGMQWDLCFHGADIDDRSKAAIAFATSASNASHFIEYALALGGALVDTQKASSRDLTARLAHKPSLLLEATSLGTVEVLLLLRAAKAAGVACVDCLYIEPLEYSRDATMGTPWSREFLLSGSRRFEGVNGFVTNFSEPAQRDTRLVAFLGYEAARLTQACEQIVAMVNWKKYAVFGVPGYAPGWEMNAIANNVGTLEGNKFQSVRYCGAASVSSAYELLLEIHEDGRSDDRRTVVAPLGTKPHGIAAAMFLVSQSSYQTASLIYDHPDRSTQRTGRVRRWHLYRLRLDAD